MLNIAILVTTTMKKILSGSKSKGNGGQKVENDNDVGACDLDLEYYKNGIKYFKQKNMHLFILAWNIVRMVYKYFK